MLRRDFYFQLPQELIAQRPLKRRGTSRLLSLEGNSGELRDNLFTDLPDLLHPNDLLVFNDTKVIPARLYGRKASGGKVEVLIERLVDEHRVLAQIKSSKSPKIGAQLHLAEQVQASVISRKQDLFELRFKSALPVVEILQRYGHIPLPPYIIHSPDEEDWERYQTVYARCPGAIAAPTAGLHFDRELLDKLTAKGFAQGFVTLHVGAGTFQPMRVERIEDHAIHGEIAAVSARLCEQVQAARARGGRIVAVGTTSLRALETACQSGDIQPFQGETHLFIYPGFSFRCVDALITNFHLPESTLLMLVAAFAGYENTMRAYRYAVAQRYRFFSYGDAMFITRRSRTT